MASGWLRVEGLRMVGWEGSKPAENLIQVVPPVETGLLVVVGAEEDTRKPARSRERPGWPRTRTNFKMVLIGFRRHRMTKRRDRGSHRHGRKS
jgi:hypothetical protein